MSDKTGISWTDATWNPIRGCSRVSEGCRHCYAERVASRFSGAGMPYEGLIKLRTVKVSTTLTKRRDGSIEERAKFEDQARWNGTVRMVPENLADPLRWRKPRRIFVNSMSDLFHESLTNEQIAAVFGVMAAAPQHTFQVLTKRARRMREWFAWLDGKTSHGNGRGEMQAEICRGTALDIGAYRAPDGSMPPGPGRALLGYDARWPLPNVWMGTSVENQPAADDRIPHLQATPAAVRFLSCEPLIGPVEIKFAMGQYIDRRGSWRSGDGVTWVIAGCESGPGARPCDVAWLRSLRDQCKRSGVPFFLKQATAAFDASEDDTYSGSLAQVIAAGAGSKRKAGGVIELPYLDGVQHAAFPEPAA